MKIKNNNLVGTVINQIKILSYIVENKRQYFDCQCFCGQNFRTRVDAIKSDNCKSCGCIKGKLISEKNKLPNNQGTINLIFRAYQNNAKKRGLSFNLSLSRFEELIFKNCFYCGSEPALSVFNYNQRRSRQIYCNGIDRKDNLIGYEEQNCLPCCHICNAAKSNLNYQEFSEWIERLVKFHGNFKKEKQIST